MKCPIHNKKMNYTNTRFGKRYSCPVMNCTVAGWDGSTSTPADYGTRQARIDAHSAFDTLWQSGMFKRHEAYKALAQAMGKTAKGTHIGMFTRTECKEVREFVREMLRQ